jgi:hypothetical protein
MRCGSEFLFHFSPPRGEKERAALRGQESAQGPFGKQTANEAAILLYRFMKK